MLISHIMLHVFLTIVHREVVACRSSKRQTSQQNQAHLSATAVAGSCMAKQRKTKNMQVMPVDYVKMKSVMKNCTLEKRMMLEERAAPTKPWGWEGSCRNLVSSGIKPSAPSLICCVMVRFCQSQKVRVSPYELGTLAGLKPYKAGTVYTESASQGWCN